MPNARNTNEAKSAAAAIVASVAVCCLRQVGGGRRQVDPDQRIFLRLDVHRFVLERSLAFDLVGHICVEGSLLGPACRFNLSADAPEWLSLREAVFTVIL